MDALVLVVNPTGHSFFSMQASWCCADVGTRDATGSLITFRPGDYLSSKEKFDILNIVVGQRRCRSKSKIDAGKITPFAEDVDDDNLQIKARAKRRV